MRALTAEELKFINEIGPKDTPRFEVETVAFWEGGDCFASTWTQDLHLHGRHLHGTRGLRARTHLRGTDHGAVSPVFAGEIPMLRALQSAHYEFLRAEPNT